MRTCKECLVSKEYRYFLRDDHGRAVHKDESGGIWHGRVCYDCQKLYVKKMSGKVELSTIECELCGKVVAQSAKRQRTCSKECYKELVKIRLGN